MSRTENKQEKKSQAMSLGFIDLLAITLIVVILQMVAIVDSGTEEGLPEPVFYNVNVYQPEHQPGDTANHFAFIEVGGHLLFWDRDPVDPSVPPNPRLGLYRDFYDPDASTWSARDDWGAPVPLTSVSPTTTDDPDNRRARIDAFIDSVREDLGVEVSILTPPNRPPRIDLFFDNSVPPFTFEIAHHECRQSRSSSVADNALYDGLVHPVQLSYARLGRQPNAGDTLYEISKNNKDEWIEGGQYTVSSFEEIRAWLAGPRTAPITSKCAGDAPQSCNVRQSESFISVTGVFDGDGLSLIDGRGGHHDVR